MPLYIILMCFYLCMLHLLVDKMTMLFLFSDFVFAFLYAQANNYNIKFACAQSGAVAFLSNIYQFFLCCKCDTLHKQ
jgi:hypothetical protein